MIQVQFQLMFLLKFTILFILLTCITSYKFLTILSNFNSQFVIEVLLNLKSINLTIKIDHLKINHFNHFIISLPNLILSLPLL
jgi:hypothetical protein